MTLLDIWSKTQHKTKQIDIEERLRKVPNMGRKFFRGTPFHFWKSFTQCFVPLVGLVIQTGSGAPVIATELNKPGVVKNGQEAADLHQTHQSK